MRSAWGRSRPAIRRDGGVGGDPGAAQDASASRAATVMARTPVSRVGWMTGANLGLWLVGMSSATRPASCAVRYVSASVPPTYQNTDGTPHWVPKDPKSSLAE